MGCSRLPGVCVPVFAAQVTGSDAYDAVGTKRRAALERTDLREAEALK